MGATPMGTIVDLNGFLTGTPTRNGNWRVGVCVIDIIGASDCGTADVRVIPRKATLRVVNTGDGHGQVHLEPASDEWMYDYGTVVTITPLPDGSSSFGGWGGECSGTGECVVTMDGDKRVDVKFVNRGGGSGTLSVKIVSGNCQTVKGEAYGPVGTVLAVYHSGGAPASVINCGSWTPGPDRQYQCQRGNNDPSGTGWAARPGSGLVDATVTGSEYDFLAGGDFMKTAQANFGCG